MKEHMKQENEELQLIDVVAEQEEEEENNGFVPLPINDQTRFDEKPLKFDENFSSFVFFSANRRKRRKNNVETTKKTIRVTKSPSKLQLRPKSSLKSNFQSNQKLNKTKKRQLFFNVLFVEKNFRLGTCCSNILKKWITRNR